MRALRDFDEFVKSGTIRHRRPDPARARSLVSEAEHRRTFLRELVRLTGGRQSWKYTM